MPMPQEPRTYPGSRAPPVAGRPLLTPKEGLLYDVPGLGKRDMP